MLSSASNMGHTCCVPGCNSGKSDLHARGVKLNIPPFLRGNKITVRDLRDYRDQADCIPKDSC